LGNKMYLPRRKRKKYFLYAWVVASATACGLVAISQSAMLKLTVQ
jgi:hypothetical protein